TNAIALAVGAEHACALIADGTLRCWGRNNSGQLGDGSILDRSLPVQPSITNVVAVSAGRATTCALLVDGTVHCWGDDRSGQLCDVATANRLAPGPAVAGLTGAVEVSAGNLFTCAVDSFGTPRCWGENARGQLGNGSTNTPALVPSTVQGITGTIGGRGITA